MSRASLFFSEVGNKLGRRQRAGKMIALRLVAIEGAQMGQYPGIFAPFGDGLEFQAVRHLDDGAHERLIDLQFVEVETSQVGQAR